MRHIHIQRRERSRIHVNTVRAETNGAVRNPRKLRLCVIQKVSIGSWTFNINVFKCMLGVVLCRVVTYLNAGCCSTDRYLSKAVMSRQSSATRGTHMVNP